MTSPPPPTSAILEQVPVRPTAKAATPPAGEPRAIWNIWASLANDERYTIQHKLQPATDYRIAVDLSAFAYDEAESGAQSVLPGERFAALLQQWLADTNRNVVKLNILLLVDTSYFEEQPPQVFSLEIDLGRMRAAGTSSQPRIADLFAELRAGGLHDFIFSKSGDDFTVRTREQPPGGAAPLAISIWDGRRPIDEMVVSFCMAGSECAGLRPVQSGFKGLDAVRLAAEQPALQPTAAIHFIQFGPTSPVLGTLWWGEMSLPIVWKVEDSAQALATRLANLMHTLSPARETANRESEGRALFHLLFPDDGAGMEARASFLQLLARHGINELPPYPQNLLPALFVRTHFAEGGTPRFLPLGMMAVQTEANQTRFVGEYLRVETPLAIQAYPQSQGSCLADWKLIGPRRTEDNALNDAYGEIARRITAAAPAGNTIKIGSRQFPLDHDLQGLASWIEEDKTDERPTFLSILAHHDRDSIYFEQRTRIHSANVQRRLGRSSIALLNGCGTGEASATGFLDALNEHGVQAAIVTVTEIPGALAGRFMECFASGIEQTSSDAKIPLAEAYTRALRCVSASHGAKALWYALLGNSGVELCGTGEMK